MDLSEARDRLDRLDTQLTDLFCRRMDIIREIAVYKKANHLPAHDPVREAAIISKLRAKAQGGWEDQVEALYAAIFQISRETQRSLGV
jgi:chorismate mutase